MVSLKDPSQIVIEIMLPKMTEENKDVLDVTKKAISKETIWQKMFTCIMRRKQIKM